jgi:hypothetical protein
MEMGRGNRTLSKPSWRRRWGVPEGRVLERAVAKLAQSDTAAASSFRTRLANAGATSAQQLAVELAQILSGDPYQRQLNRDQFPSTCPVCRREISAIDIIAQDRRSGARLHSRCAPRPPGAFAGSEPLSALEWLQTHLSDA